MYSSQQRLEHSTELMRKPSLIKALSSKQHSFMYNSTQNIMHDYMDAVYHMNDMWWMASV